MKRVRLGFDIAPSQSGPGRYVSAIVAALDPDEFEVVVFDPPSADMRSWSHVRYVGEHTNKGADAPSESAQAVLRRSPLRQYLRRLAPKACTLWAGFHRDARRLSRAISTQKVDVFHAQNTGCEEMPVAARLAGVPFVLGTFHVDSTVDIARERSGFTHRAMEGYSNRSLHLAIAVSEATKQDWMRRTGIRAERVLTIHNGIDPDQFVRQQSKRDARAKLGLPQDAVILGGLGRLDPAKGFAHLIEALAALRCDFPNALVAIAGTGSLREQLETKAQVLGVADRVVFLGFQTDVNLVLDACDVFVLSSLCEALPFALLEAMAHELPAVGTKVGGIPEVIVPGETGFLAPARDGAALANAIRPLLESAGLRQRLGRAGRERIVRDFHEADTVRKTLDVYRQMLTGNRGAGTWT